MTHPQTGDADLPGAKDGLDLEDFERAFMEHANSLTRFVYSYVKSWEAAEDIVHDVFFQLWLRHRTVEPVRDLLAYLYTIARYDALDYLRHQGIEARHRSDSGHEAALSISADHEMLASEAAASLQRAVDMLPTRQREIILLRLEKQASYEEIAAELHISRKTVDTHIQRAFAKLRALLPRSLG